MNFKNDCDKINQNMNNRGFQLHYAQVFDKGTDINIGINMLSLFGFKKKPKLTNFDGVTFIHEINRNDWNSGIKFHVRNYDGDFLIKTSFRTDSYKTSENELFAIEVENALKDEFLNSGYKLK